jgi:hypothetical protein
MNKPTDLIRWARNSRHTRAKVTRTQLVREAKVRGIDPGAVLAPVHAKYQQVGIQPLPL